MLLQVEELLAQLDFLRTEVEAEASDPRNELRPGIPARRPVPENRTSPFQAFCSRLAVNCVRPTSQNRQPMSECKVLVVDDDEPIRRLIGTVLRRAGFEIDEARHGGEAVSLMQENEYDVILMDLMMPVLSGFEVIEWLGEYHHDRLKCVVVMSAAADRDLARLDPQVVFGVLRKPFDLDAVVGTVEQCSGREPER